ncbi:MAG: hypothetical protein M3Q98_01745 [Actinomycetota bacterium]|nr:hypothetical protein [Actinomycetota bacterium]
METAIAMHSLLSFVSGFGALFLQLSFHEDVRARLAGRLGRLKTASDASPA